MHIILVPGFWLDASSWDLVTSPLEAAGHTVQPLTLPGLESREADRAGIGVEEHVSAIVAAIDAAPRPLALVGHSGAAALSYAALDRRPDAVDHIVFVDTPPLPSGTPVNTELPAVDGEIPLPEWDVFDEPSLRGLGDAERALFRDSAVPEPEGVATQPIELNGDPDARRSVPATLVTCEMTAEQVRELMESGHPFTSELAALTDCDIVEIETGHWPQFTTPGELGAVIVDALRSERA